MNPNLLDTQTAVLNQLPIQCKQATLGRKNSKKYENKHHLPAVWLLMAFFKEVLLHGGKP